MLVLAATKMKSGNPALFRNFCTAKGKTNLVHRLLVDDLGRFRNRVEALTVGPAY
jgi:hypothetical protein